ncbi:MAG: hypothetical protein ACREB3_06195 [Burkholderiales bacterium]
MAAEASKWFEQKTRDKGEKFWTLKNGRPQWAQDMVQEAHDTGGGNLMLPDDWRYESIVDALDRIQDASDDADLDELADEIEADVYNADLLKWLSSHLERAGYVDEAVNNLGWDKDGGIFRAIQAGQIAEKREVYFSVLATLRERIEEVAGE